MDMLGDKFWYQVVMGPTHRNDNTLDLCTPSSEELVRKVKVEVT